MTTATTENKKPEIKAEVESLAATIQASFELDTTSGIAVPTTNVYEDAATKAGLTQEQIGQVKKFETTVWAATTLAIGRTGVEAMAKNADLQEVQTTIKGYGDETFTAGVRRETISRNPRTGETASVHGQTFTQLTVTSAANKGQMAKVRSAIRALGTEQLSKNA